MKLKVQSVTLAADEEARLAPFQIASNYQWVSLQIKTDQAISVWIAHGRRNTAQGDEPDVPAMGEDDPASLPDATEAAEVAANSGVEGGQGLRFELFGGPDVGQIVLHNTSESEATVIVKGRLW